MKFVVSALAVLSAAPLCPAVAQSFPSKPIELVVHTGPGGGSDLVARTFAEVVARDKLLPQILIVQNRSGGGGAIAQNYVAGKRGDPYTLLSAAVSVILSVPMRTGMDVGLDKFHPLGMIGIDLNALAVREDSPYRTVQDLVNAAKAKPKSINIAIGSTGATAHYFAYHIERLTGARFNIVSFKSGPDAAIAVLGGHVHATTENLADVLPQAESKKMLILGIPAEKRLTGLPNVPTMKEQGLDLHIGAGRGFAAPAGIPRDAAVLLEQTVAKVHKSAGWREFMAKNMYEDVYMNGEEFGRYLAVRQVDMNRFLTDMGLVQKKP
ncbi:MAG TPA: tripartite tricarboxylate transporter substrate binding protein [Burkholderiales bacterium]|nr:tripartite tricarboxylate transporter substrate binding protein [Burkholderiales bacterium]